MSRPVDLVTAEVIHSAMETAVVTGTVAAMDLKLDQAATLALRATTPEGTA